MARLEPTLELIFSALHSVVVCVFLTLSVMENDLLTKRLAAHWCYNRGRYCITGKFLSLFMPIVVN